MTAADDLDDIHLATSSDDLLAALRAAGPVQDLLGRRTLTRLRDSVHDQETVGVNPYWDIVRELPLAGMPVSPLLGFSEVEIERFPRDLPPGADREVLVRAYAWSIPSPRDIACLATAAQGRDVVEIGAGTGYWAWQLAQAGVRVWAYDRHPEGKTRYCGPTRYVPVVQGGPEKAAVHSDAVLLLCWPPPGSMPIEALGTYAGDTVIFIGESNPYVCADEDFYAELDKNWTGVGVSTGHVTFGMIHDQVQIWQRS